MVYHGSSWRLLWGPRACCVSSARVVYTSIYWYVIHIFLYKLLYTCVNLVYTDIYACIHKYIPVYTRHTPITYWNIRIYTKYMTGLFPCYVIWPGHFYGIGWYAPYVHFHVSVIFLYQHNLLLSNFSPSSQHNSIFDSEYISLASRYFRMSGFCLGTRSRILTESDPAGQCFRVHPRTVSRIRVRGISGVTAPLP
jgi:hypothetical protein